jgi:hypothetical protein
VTALDADRLREQSLGYEDLVGAADVVVTAIGAGTRLVYTERGDFPEYPVLVREMERYLACAHVSNRDLLEGRLLEPLRLAMSRPQPDPPDTRGAEVAARRLLGMLG